MARFRKTYLQYMEELFAKATIDCNHSSIETTLAWYIAKHGIFHLLILDDKENAKKCLLDIYFVANFRTLWKDSPNTLAPIRYVGVQNMRDAYYAQIALFVDVVATEKMALAAKDTAIFLRDIGLYDVGLEYVDWAYKVLKTQKGVNSLETLLVGTELALFCSLQGNTQKALGLLTTILEQQEISLGPEHPSTLKTAHVLAGVYSDIDNEEAEVLYIRTLTGRESVLGKIHPDTLVSVSDLARLYLHQQKYADAEALTLRFIQGRTEIFGSEHLYTKMGLHNLAVVYLEQQQYSKAEELFTSVLPWYKTILGRLHPSTLNVIYNIGYLYEQLQEYHKAEELYTEELDGIVQTMGWGHPYTKEALDSLFGLYMNLQRYEEVSSLYYRVIEGLEQEKGENDTLVLNYIHSFARWNDRLGRYDEAEKLYIVVYQRKTNIYGSKHIQTIDAAMNVKFLQQKKQQRATNSNIQ